MAQLALAARQRLAEAFATAAPDAWKRTRKAEILADLRRTYHDRRPEPGDRWDGFFDDGLNNARLAALGAYHELVPALRTLLAGCGGDLERFYRQAESLAGLPPELRRQRLEATDATGDGYGRLSRAARRQAPDAPVRDQRY